MKWKNTEKRAIDMLQTTESAYAKINLFLDITGKRDNGYHEIDGVMQSVSLCDEVEVAFSQADEIKVRMRAEGNPEMPTDERNIAVKAAIRFLERVGMTGEVQIFLNKRIPMAGGLAGGSTDAAAVLRALNRLLDTPLSSDELLVLGASLGADVPFCIMGGTARTQGIGDLLTPLSPMPDCHIVVARRGEGVSTPWAYGRLDALYADFAEPSAENAAKLQCLLSALEAASLEEVCASVYNIFEATVAQCRPDVGLLCEHLRGEGAVLARMSGSGPSVFGIFADRKQAEAACRSIRLLGAEAFVCGAQGAIAE